MSHISHLHVRILKSCVPYFTSPCPHIKILCPIFHISMSCILKSCVPYFTSPPSSSGSSLPLFVFGKVEASDWWWPAGDHGKDTDGRRSLLRASLCAHIFIERERRLGTRQSHLHVLHIMSSCPIAYISMPCIFKSPCLKSLHTHPNVPIQVLIPVLGKAMTFTCSFLSNRTWTQMLKQSFHFCLNLCRRVLKKTRKERKHHLQ